MTVHWVRSQILVQNQGALGENVTLDLSVSTLKAGIWKKNHRKWQKWSLKIGKGNLDLTENRLSWNEMCCASDNHNYMCHTCAKEFSNLSFNKAVIDKNINFSRYCSKFHIFTYFRNFSSIFATFYTKCFYPINFMALTCQEIQEYSFIFDSCEPVSAVERVTLLRFLFGMHPY